MKYIFNFLCVNIVSAAWCWFNCPTTSTVKKPKTVVTTAAPTTANVNTTAAPQNPADASMENQVSYDRPMVSIKVSLNGAQPVLRIMPAGTDGQKLKTNANINKFGWHHSIRRLKHEFTCSPDLLLKRSLGIKFTINDDWPFHRYAYIVSQKIVDKAEDSENSTDYYDFESSTPHGAALKVFANTTERTSGQAPELDLNPVTNVSGDFNDRYREVLSMLKEDQLSSGPVILRKINGTTYCKPKWPFLQGSNIEPRPASISDEFEGGRIREGYHQVLDNTGTDGENPLLSDNTAEWLEAHWSLVVDRVLAGEQSLDYLDRNHMETIIKESRNGQSEVMKTLDITQVQIDMFAKSKTIYLPTDRRYLLLMKDTREAITVTCNANKYMYEDNLMDIFMKEIKDCTGLRDCDERRTPRIQVSHTIPTHIPSRDYEDRSLRTYELKLWVAVLVMWSSPIVLVVLVILVARRYIKLREKIQMEEQIALMIRPDSTKSDRRTSASIRQTNL